MTRSLACALSLLLAFSSFANAQEDEPAPVPEQQAAPEQQAPPEPQPMTQQQSPPPAQQSPQQFHAASSEQFPGKYQVGLSPLGVQARFDGNSVSGYKFTGDVAGLLKSYDKFSLWVGGGFDYTYGSLSHSNPTVLPSADHDLQLWAFAMLSMEKLIHFPLVPFVRAGIGGDILLFNGVGGSLAGGAFIVRFGGGLHYYVTKNVGLGVETNFTLGPGIYPAAVVGNCAAGSNSCTSFYGNWDFLIGARFAF
ncbi:MAG: hypothetical protein ACHQ17_05425 [Polyangia bacterium]